MNQPPNPRQQRRPANAPPRKTSGASGPPQCTPPSCEEWEDAARLYQQAVSNLENSRRLSVTGEALRVVERNVQDLASALTELETRQATAERQQRQKTATASARRPAEAPAPWR